ncbi:MAG: hypothetical protein ACC628_05650 [Pirellulaceae bacterium]
MATFLFEDFVSNGLLDNAPWYDFIIDCYRRCGAKRKECRAYIAGEWFVEAAEVLIELHEYETAAEIFERRSWFAEAARIYLELGRQDRAKQMAEKCAEERERDRILAELS